MKKLSIFLSFVIAIAVFAGTSADAAETYNNWISQLSTDEFDALQTYRMLDSSEIKPYPSEKAAGRDFPDSWDWRTMGGVTEVKDQAQCGSCWAFAATGVLEAQILIQTGVAYDLSEQQQVDCTPGSYGCNGGTTESAWSYLSWEPARAEVDYPYEAENGECRAKNYPAYIRTTGYDAYYVSEEADIKQALMDYGPVATSMGANDNLKAYSGGCYADDANTGINHGVVIVGWDDNICEGGSWIVRNSWGDDFGEAGYFNIRRGDVHLGDYISMVYFEVLPAVEFGVTHMSFLDASGMVPEPGAVASMDFQVTNTGRELAETVTATLTTESSDVTIQTAEISLQNIDVGESINVTDAFGITLAQDLEPGQVIDFRITVTSTGGESTVSVKMIVGPLFPVYSNDFEGSSDEGWTHGSNRKDKWGRGIPGENDFPRFDPVAAYSGEHMWGIRLDKSGNYPANHDTWLNSPVFDCNGHDRVLVRFKRWLSVEKGIYDNATFSVNGDVLWENPSADDLIDTEWQDIIYDVTEKIDTNGNLQFSFGLQSDGGLEFGGWNIDDFEVLSGVTSDFTSTFQEQLHVSLGMPDTEMETGDTFQLYYECRNFSQEKTVMEYIALDVGGLFYFWPNWSEAIDGRQRTVDAMSFDLDTVLTFQWPEVEGSFSDVRFWFASIDANDGTIYDYDMLQWGW